jgi:nucleoside-diphosphate-sugar epimerase
LRAGDYFGGNAPASWFQNVLVKPGKPLRSVTYPGRPGVGHAWAYLPDLAETMVQLVEREADLAPFETFHFGGHYCERGVEMAEAICTAAGLDPARRIRRFPWPVITLASPFVRLFRELREMRYLWQVPIRPDNAKLVAFLGAEPHTSLPDAVRSTLAVLKCV